MEGRKTQDVLLLFLFQTVFLLQCNVVIATGGQNRRTDALYLNVFKNTLIVKLCGLKGLKGLTRKSICRQSSHEPESSRQ